MSNSIKNIKLTIEYDGSNYHGWQRQPNVITIQETLEGCLQKMTAENVSIIGSGRTDAGVHARAQVANFKSSTNIPPESFMNGLNSLLPKDITIIDAECVPNDFSSRFSAKEKHYQYIILNRRLRSSFEYRYSWRIACKLDIDAMIRGAEYLKGEHDFSSFRASSCGSHNPVKNIKQIEILTQGEKIIFNIKGSGFLKQMVRNIVGTLVLVGKGKINSSDIKNILDAKDRTQAGPTAPPQGLFLIGVDYKKKVKSLY